MVVTPVPEMDTTADYLKEKKQNGALNWRLLRSLGRAKTHTLDYSLEVCSVARKPETTWDMLNIAMSHYQEHIQAKKDHCSLSIVDLLHVSNFKGGNASITESLGTLSRKIKYYEAALRKVEQNFSGKTLSKLTAIELNTLISLCNEHLTLTTKDFSQIRGVGPSYASAILAAHHLNLIPVLDRRALNGAGIAVIKDSQNQVKNIASHYGQLIRAFHAELTRRPGLSVRQLDKEWFSAIL